MDGGTYDGISLEDMLGRMDEASVDRLRVAVEQYAGKIPAWMANRPKDVYTGEKKHLFGADVSLTKDEDVNLMRKIRCYRGIRHETGQKRPPDQKAPCPVWS